MENRRKKADSSTGRSKTAAKKSAFEAAEERFDAKGIRNEDENLEKKLGKPARRRRDEEETVPRARRTRVTKEDSSNNTFSFVKDTARSDRRADDSNANRSYKRKPDSFEIPEDRRPSSRSSKDPGERKPYRRSDNEGERRPARRFGEDSGERKSFRRSDNDGERRPARRFGEDSGERKPYRRSDNEGERRPARKFGEDSGERKSFRRSDNEGERRPARKFGEDSGERKPYKRFDDRKRGEKAYGRKDSKSKKPVGSDDKDSIRLNKYIANAGICSRREADELIVAGAIKVNGVIVSELGSRVSRFDKVQYEDQTLRSERPVYVLLNKPKGYITTTDDPFERKTVMTLVENAGKERIYPVGRLDRNTTGLLLLTNDGEIATKLMHPKHKVEKLYHVELDKALTKGDMMTIVEGIELEDGFIQVDEIAYSEDGKNKKEIGVKIHSGRNRIVRRIFESLGYEVVKLDRVIFAGLTKKDLPRGDWRFLTEKEINFLKMIK